MPRKKPPTHIYGVYITFYADETIKERVERGEEFIISPEQVTTQLVYLGSSRSVAVNSFFRAAQAAMNNPLADTVKVEMGDEVLIRVRIEHH